MIIGEELPGGFRKGCRAQVASAASAGEVKSLPGGIARQASFDHVADVAPLASELHLSLALA
ncbi:MAG: hypothetical protein ACE5Q6_27710, partial [Dehalococcoidia bacterium]